MKKEDDVGFFGDVIHVCVVYFGDACTLEDDFLGGFDEEFFGVDVEIDNVFDVNVDGVKAEWCSPVDDDVVVFVDFHNVGRYVGFAFDDDVFVVFVRFFVE